MPVESSPVWLTAEQQRAWSAFIAVVQQLPGRLDAQLQRDAGDTHFEYLTMAVLSDAQNRTLRITALAAMTHSTLPRLSHVLTRLQGRGYVERTPCPQDGRATNAVLTEVGWSHLQAVAPGHVATVRDLVIDPLRADQIAALLDITSSMLARLENSHRSAQVG